MNGPNPFFIDQRVRRAMTQAMNVPLILDKVYYNLARPCAGIYHPEMETFNPQEQRLKYDLEQAEKLLDEAGWRVDDKDGRRYKDSDRKTPFRFTLLIPNNLSGGAQIGAILQEDLRKIGVEMDIRVMEWMPYVEKLRGHEFEAALGSWDPGGDPDWEYMVWHSSGYEGGRNYGGYNNRRVDELLDEGRLEFDELSRRKIYQHIHQLTYEDQPYTWICHLPILAVFNKRIQGLQFSGRGIYGFYPSFYRWWSVKEN